MPRSGWKKPGPKKPRAGRKEDAEWTKHRRLLTRLYKEYPLNHVMTYMENKHCFYASPRQYGYRFDLWGVRKYRTDTRRNSNRSIQEMDELVINTKDYDSLDSQTPDTSPDTSLSMESMTPESEISLSDHESELTDESPIIYVWVLDEEKRKLAADFSCMMNDRDAAFQHYRDLYKSMQERPETSWMEKEVLLISCVRAAQDPVHVREARRLLSEHLAQFQVPHESFVFSMLEADIAEPSGNADAVTRDQFNGIIASVVRRVDANDKHGGHMNQSTLVDISNGNHSYDVLAFQYLYHGLRAYKNRVTDKSSTNGGQGNFFILGHYTRPMHHTRCNHCMAILKPCIEWCLTQLKSNPQIPGNVSSSKLGGRQQLRDEDVQLFGSLWWAMCQAISDKEHTLKWYRECELALNISPSELLAVICGMIGDKARENSANAGILQTAVVAAQVLLKNLSVGELWMAFLKKFISTNRLVKSPGQKDESLTDTARDHVREFVSSRLGVKLQAPTPNPTPEMSYLDVMPSDDEMYETLGLPLMGEMQAY